MSPYSTRNYLNGEEATRKYLETIGRTLEGLRKKGLSSLKLPLLTPM